MERKSDNKRVVQFDMYIISYQNSDVKNTKSKIYLHVSTYYSVY